QQPADLARLAVGARRRLVDRGIALREVARLHITQARQPAVAEPPGQPQHAGLVGADVEGDRMRGSRPALGPAGTVVLPVDAHAPSLAGVPDLADDRDRLAQRIDALPGGELRAAHRLDRVPEAAGAQAQLDAAAGEQVEAR